MFTSLNKYRAKRTTVDGLTFDSQREARRWQALVMLERAGEIGGLTRQVAYDLTVNGQCVAKYVADFCYLDMTGLVVEDAKGVRTPVYRLKKKLMLAIHGIAIREV